MHPDDIGKVLVAISQILSVLKCFGRTIFSENIQPTDGLDGIQEYNHAVVRRDAEHIIDTLKIRRIWCCNVARNQKRNNSIKSLCLPIATRLSKNTKQIDPKRVDAIASTICHKCCSFLLRQIGDQVLRRVSDHQEWSIVLVDEIAVVGACLERIDGTVRRSKYSDVRRNLLRRRARHRRDEYGCPQERSSYRMRKPFPCRACGAPDPKRHRRSQHSNLLFFRTYRQSYHVASANNGYWHQHPDPRRSRHRVNSRGFIRSPRRCATGTIAGHCA